MIEYFDKWTLEGLYEPGMRFNLPSSFYLNGGELFFHGPCPLTSGFILKHLLHQIVISPEPKCIFLFFFRFAKRLY